MEDVVRAVRDARISATAGGSVAAKLCPEGADVVAWLRSDDAPTRRFALEIVLCATTSPPSAEVMSAAAEALTRTKLAPFVRGKLEAKLSR